MKRSIKCLPILFVATTSFDDESGVDYIQRAIQEQNDPSKSLDYLFKHTVKNLRHHEEFGYYCWKWGRVVDKLDEYNTDRKYSVFKNHVESLVIRLVCTHDDWDSLPQKRRAVHVPLHLELVGYIEDLLELWKINYHHILRNGEPIISMDKIQ